VLKKIIDAIKDLLNDANWDCTEEGLSLQAMDSSHVALVSLDLKAESFDEFRCNRNFTLGINLVNMAKIMKCAANDDSVTLKAREDGDTITFIFESDDQERQSEYEIKLMELDGDNLGIPETEHSCIIRMPSAEFARICRDLSQLGDTLQITCTKNGVKFSTKGDIGNGAVRLSQTTKVGKEEDAVTIDLRDPCITTFAIKYLIAFTKATPLANQVTLYVSNDVPIVVEYEIKRMGHLRYYLAPKIDDNVPKAAERPAETVD